MFLNSQLFVNLCLLSNHICFLMIIILAEKTVCPLVFISFQSYSLMSCFSKTTSQSLIVIQNHAQFNS